MTIVQAIDAKSGRTTTSKNIMDALSYYFEAAEKVSIADNVKPVRGHNITRAIDAYAGNDYSRTIVEAIDKYTGKGPSLNIMEAIENLEKVEPVPPTPPGPTKYTYITAGPSSVSLPTSTGSGVNLSGLTVIDKNFPDDVNRVKIELTNVKIDDVLIDDTFSATEECSISTYMIDFGYINEAVSLGGDSLLKPEYRDNPSLFIFSDNTDYKTLTFDSLKVTVWKEESL